MSIWSFLFSDESENGDSDSISYRVGYMLGRALRGAYDSSSDDDDDNTNPAMRAAVERIMTGGTSQDRARLKARVAAIVDGNGAEAEEEPTLSDEDREAEESFRMLMEDNNDLFENEEHDS